MEDNKYISYRRQKYISSKECLYWTKSIPKGLPLGSWKKMEPKIQGPVAGNVYNNSLSFLKFSSKFV